MYVRNHSNATDFLAAARPVLEQREALNALTLGLCERAVDSPEDQPAILMTAESKGKVVGTVVQTKGYPIVLTADDPLVIDPLVAALMNGKETVSGVVAETALSKSFADRWADVSGMHSTVGMRLGIYQLDQVVMPPDHGGSMRLASPNDLDQTVDWMNHFVREALPNEPHDDELMRELTMVKIGRGEVYLWIVDGRPVGTTSITGPTRHGVRINGVYTPPAGRGRGVASSLVAHLSQAMLDDGKRFCMLYTDLSNPSSNAAYVKVGYRAIGDSVRYDFRMNDQVERPR